MFHTLLLSVFSVVCLVFSIVVGRAKPGRYDSPFLQRDNWPGYALASLGVTAAAWRSFQAFSWQYELAHNEPLEPNLRRALDLDFHQPIPWAYGMLAVGLLCYRAWKRRKRVSVEPRHQKRAVSGNAVAATLVALVTLACFVWPTPWQYGVFPDKEIAVSPGLFSSTDTGLLPCDLEPCQSLSVENSRRNRATGEIELKIKGHWYSDPEFCLCASSG
jgi:hypothetical protein